MFTAILAASVAVAGVLVRRHHRPAVRPAQPSERSSPTTALASSPVSVPSPEALSAERGVGNSRPVPSSEAALPVVEDPLTDALCPRGMLLVDGVTCGARPARCVEPESGGCRRFEAAECRKGQALRFCVDRYEYPNLDGVLPATMVTFEQARTACEEEDKRLCSETEWRFACEGRTGFELPYGNTLDQDACNVGRASERVRPDELWEARDVSRVVSRVDRRVTSGSMARCTSPFGVRDMTGNVEEWGSGASGLEAALLGGDALAREPRCRTVRKTHQTALRTPHSGFRCCRDPLVRAPERPRSGPESPDP